MFLCLRWSTLSSNMCLYAGVGGQCGANTVCLDALVVCSGCVLQLQNTFKNILPTYEYIPFMNTCEPHSDILYFEHVTIKLYLLQMETDQVHEVDTAQLH